MTAYKNYGKHQTLEEFKADLKNTPSMDKLGKPKLIQEALEDNFSGNIIGTQLARLERLGVISEDKAIEQARFKGDMSGACCYVLNKPFDPPQSIDDVVSRLDTLESLQNAMALHFNLSGQTDPKERDRTRMMMANVVANVMHGVPVDEVLHNICIENKVPQSLYGSQRPKEVMKEVSNAFKREQLGKRMSSDFLIQGKLELEVKNNSQYLVTEGLLRAIQEKLDANGISPEKASEKVLKQVAALPELLNDAGFKFEVYDIDHPATKNFALVKDAVAEAVDKGESLVKVLMQNDDVRNALNAGGGDITKIVKGVITVTQNGHNGNTVIPSNKPPGPALNLFGGI